MKKAPYVEIRDRKNSRSYRVKPSAKLLRYFPDLKPDRFETLTEANAVGYAWQRKLDTHLKGGTDTHTSDDKYSVRSLINEWKASPAYRDNDLSTMRSYASHIEYCMNFKLRGESVRFDEMKATDVTYEHAKYLFNDIEDDVSTHKAVTTFMRLRAAWNEGIKCGLANVNPFALVKLPELEARAVLWSEDMVTQAIEQCDAVGRYSMGTMITLCYHWCQRPVDIRRLRWRDVETGIGYFRQKKTKARMAIPLTQGIKDRLALHEELLGDERYFDDIILREEPTQKPYTVDRVSVVFKKVVVKPLKWSMVQDGDRLDDNGEPLLTYPRIGDLRRTGTTHASRSGCTDRELMALTGHKNPSMLVIYARAGEIEATNAMNKRGLLTAMGHNGGPVMEDRVGWKAAAQQIETGQLPDKALIEAQNEIKRLKQQLKKIRN